MFIYKLYLSVALVLSNHIYVIYSKIIYIKNNDNDMVTQV